MLISLCVSVCVLCACACVRETNRYKQRQIERGAREGKERRWEDGREGEETGGERIDRLCISVWLVAHSTAFVCLVLRFYLSASTLSLRDEKFFFWLKICSKFAQDYIVTPIFLVKNCIHLEFPSVKVKVWKELKLQTVSLERDTNWITCQVSSFNFSKQCCKGYCIQISFISDVIALTYKSISFFWNMVCYHLCLHHRRNSFPVE